MSVVQVALAGGVVLIAVMADRLFGFEVGRRQWAGLAPDRRRPGPARRHAPAMHGAHSHSHAAMIAFEAGSSGSAAS